MQTLFTTFAHYYPDAPVEPLKINFYMYTRVTSLQPVYMQLAPLSPKYIMIYAQKNKKKLEFSPTM